MIDNPLVASASKILPQTVINTVQSLGWKEVVFGRKDVRTFQFRKNGLDLYQVIVPLDPDLGDYARALYYCARELATFQDKSVPRVILELRKAEIIEKLAATEHDQWNNILRYLQTKGLDPKAFSPVDWSRWMKQQNTPYTDLSEKEKESDKVWAEKAFDILIDFL